MENVMSKYYAYSMVHREKSGEMKHYISHCKAVSKAEAKGIALDEFDEEYPKCTQLSLLIREISPIGEQENAQVDKNLQHSYNTTYITPEFTLK